MKGLTGFCPVSRPFLTLSRLCSNGMDQNIAMFERF